MRKLFILLFFIIPSVAFAQSRTAFDSSIVKTIDGTVNEVLKIVSGERGQKRNWEAFRYLFSPNAQISVLNHGKNGVNTLNAYSLEEFVRLGMRFYENDGFIEYELAKTVDEYNGIAQVFQSYYAKELDIEERGINSFQLVHDGSRWWITSILWTSDRNGTKLPEKYLKKQAAK